MAEQISKLTPDRDLQAYFLTPSAIAALSSASSTGFVFSGKWRQQLDWAVVEWNRDNVFEHPSLRNLPDGDLSGIVLTYQEERVGCIPLESNLFPLVEWDRLRIWVANPDGSEDIWYVSLAGTNPVPIEGSAQPASGVMTVATVPQPGTRVGLALFEEHYYYQVQDGDTVADVANGVASAVASTNFSASANGASVTVTCSGTSSALYGANGNRITMYGFQNDSPTVWEAPSVVFSGGAFPSRYQITLDFGNLQGTTDSTPGAIPMGKVTTTNVRKLRWTYAADLQNNEFNQTEFTVTISNWSVTGTNLLYSVAGPGSRRIEDTDAGVTFGGSWFTDTGNYSGSKIHYTSSVGDSCTIVYSEAAQHELYLGTRRTATAPNINIYLDGIETFTFNLHLAGEDVLIRLPLGTVAPGSHQITVTHTGPAGNAFYFDFLEIAYPSNNLPDLPSNSQLALATDWDTYHSQSLAAERTAWLIKKLGFTGRVNHYVGALWFYEIVRTGTQYATLTIQFELNASRVDSPNVTFNLASAEGETPTKIDHLLLPDDDNSTVAIAIAAIINSGINLVWASTSGNSLTLTARAMGTAGNNIYFSSTTDSPDVTITAPSTTLNGGIDGTPYEPSDDPDSTLAAWTEYWRTDLSAIPPINLAARNWHTAYFAAIKNYGMDVVASFSTELGDGDPSVATGIVQRFYDGTAVVLPTPSIQTNFSPTSLAYWTAVYLEIANLQNAAGLVPYLQSGEVQWWYYPNTGVFTGVSMPFYDAYTQQQFLAQYGVPMQEIPSNTADPSLYPNEVTFLPTLIGDYTAAIRSALQQAYPGCRFEVLYPTDTNNTALNSLINYPSTDWTPANLTCLKTESFQFTSGYNLVDCTMSMNTSAAKGFPNPQRAHLIGISDAWSAWLKEANIAQSEGLETIVLFALDQYCLIGYPPPPFVNSTSSSRQG